MWKRSNACSRPVLIPRGLVYQHDEPVHALCSFEGAREPRPDLTSQSFPVAMARGIHLFPFRTEKLSPSAPMVLGPKGPGRVGRRRIQRRRVGAFGRRPVRRPAPVSGGVLRRRGGDQRHVEALEAPAGHVDDRQAAVAGAAPRRGARRASRRRRRGRRQRGSRRRARTPRRPPGCRTRRRCARAPRPRGPAAPRTSRRPPRRSRRTRGGRRRPAPPRGSRCACGPSTSRCRSRAGRRR